MSSDPQYYIESADEKYKRKLKDNPMLTAGIVGLISTVIYGGYLYKRRGNMSTSLFLMQLRVSAQGMVVGALSISMLWETAKLIQRQMNEPSEPV